MIPLALNSPRCGWRTALGCIRNVLNLPKSSLQTRVIDVGPNTLPSSNSNREPFLFESGGRVVVGRYVTLSHRWEPSLSFKTTKANLERHKQAIPLWALPATFRDAVIVCRKVGIRDLWIDAICVIKVLEED